MAIGTDTAASPSLGSILSGSAVKTIVRASSSLAPSRSSSSSSHTPTTPQNSATCSRGTTRMGSGRWAWASRMWRPSASNSARTTPATEGGADDPRRRRGREPGKRADVGADGAEDACVGAADIAELEDDASGEGSAAEWAVTLVRALLSVEEDGDEGGGRSPSVCVRAACSARRLSNVDRGRVLTSIEDGVEVGDLGAATETARARGVGRMMVRGVVLFARGTAMDRCLRTVACVSFATFVDTETVLFRLNLLGTVGVAVPEDKGDAGEEDNSSVCALDFRRESKRRPKNILRCRRRLVGLNEGTTD